MPNCVGCGAADATLACPTCIKLKLPVSNFCNQQCFKDNWAQHKLMHKLATVESKVKSSGAWDSDPHLRRFVGYSFTGALRPAKITPQKTVPSHIKLTDYAKAGLPISEQKNRRNVHIHAHTADEIARMRECCKIAREALDLATSMIKPGVTGDEIDTKVHDFIVDEGGYPSPLNYHHFPKSLCVSPNEVICHGIPDLRPFEDGDIINIDITVYYKGMHADLNETFKCGEVNEENVRLLEGAYACLWTAIKMCKPGVMYRDLGAEIQKCAQGRKLAVVKTYCGHGVGELFHTNPNVPHYAKNKAIGTMKPGHIFTIEPMINLGDWRDTTWPDDWTAVTRDGSWSAQFEHTLLITETGVEVLTARLPTSPPLGFDTSIDEMDE